MGKIHNKRMIGTGVQSTSVLSKINSNSFDLYTDGKKMPNLVENSKDNQKNINEHERQPTPKSLRQEVRKELASSAKEACKVLSDNGFDKLAASVMNLTAKAVRDKFSVSFVGEFSHGKSTVINKLLGEDILPTDILPTTSLLTRISCGKENGFEVINKHGKLIQRLPLESKSWSGLVAYDIDGNPIDLEDRSLVKLSLANKWLCQVGIDIYDTPGANDGTKTRDLDISRALMLTDGAVVCIDAQKGIMITQEAFIRDRLLSPKVPYVAIALTHVDMISKDNRDRVVASIIGKLKKMKVEMPVVIVNDVEMPSDKFVEMVGIDKLRALLNNWRLNPDRAHRIESWLAANIQSVLMSATHALEQKKVILSSKGEERLKLIIEKQKAIADLHSEWDKIRVDIQKRCELCHHDFNHKLSQENSNIIKSMLYRISTVPDPAKWYDQSYAYEISTRVSAAIISLDNLVSETARNDFDKINRDIMARYKIAMERDAKTWGRTPDSTAYIHSKAPEMTDISILQDKSTKMTAVVTAAGGLLATILFGVGGVVGTIGASTAARLLTKNKIDKEVANARKELEKYVVDDIKTVLVDATKDCESRISLIYADMTRATFLSESAWMNTQMDMITSASKPSEDSASEAEKSINNKIKEITSVFETLNKFIY